MWPLSRFDETIVSIVIDNRAISMGIIQSTQSHTQASYQLYANRTVTSQGAIIDGICYNRAAIIKVLSAFITTHRVQHALFSLCIVPNAHVQEQYIAVDTMYPPITSIMPYVKQSTAWNMLYLYETDPGQYLFMLNTIPHEVIMHYTLLAQQLEINLTTITTPLYPLLSLYQLIQGACYRQTQLALDMKRHQNKLTNYFTPDITRRIIAHQDGATPPPTHSLYMTGLYQLEKGNL